MQPEHQTDAPTIELGTASTDTRGPLGEMIEPVGLWRRIPFEAD